MVQGKWLTAQMWGRYINKNHPPSDYSLVGAMMLHHYMSYDPTLRHLELSVKLNNQGVYNHFLAGNNISTLYCYQIFKNYDEDNYHKANT